MTAAATRPPSRRRRTIVLVLVAVLAVLLLAAAWVAVRTLLAKGELESAVRLAGAAQEDIDAGETQAASGDVRDLAAHARTAADLTSDPVSHVARLIPGVGPNLRAFGDVATVIDEVAEGALIPLLVAVDTFDDESLTPRAGRVDLAPITEVAPTLAQAEKVLLGAADDVDGIDTTATLPEIADAVTELSGILDDTGSIVTAASRTAQLLPSMLGADEDRQYLLLFQNNAEVRATGGLPGALALIATSDGSFEMTQQASANDFPRYPEPVLPLDFATESLYGSLTGRYMQNVGLTPDFPTSARLASEMWRLETGLEVDGVIAVDPVLLGYVLEATGPITLSSGDVLDSGNAVDFLLSEVYEKYPDNATQDALFADAARGVFGALGTSDLESSKLIEALAVGSREGRMLIWNARDDEQAILDGTQFTGALPEDNLEDTTIGVFFDDATGAKMDYYLDSQVRVEADTCDAAAPTWTAAVHVESSAPADAATSLPSYVTGAGAFDVPPGTVRTRVIVYGPVGSTVRGVSKDGEPIDVQVEQHLGRAAAQIVLDLTPGQDADLSVDFQGATGVAGPTQVRMTPLVDFTTPEIVNRECG